MNTKLTVYKNGAWMVEKYEAYSNTTDIGPAYLFPQTDAEVKHQIDFYTKRGAEIVDQRVTA